MKITSQVPILIADDDQEDRQMIKEALQESRVVNELFFVNDGEDLMDYLLHEGKFADKKRYPRPGLILLDLNMPKKDGREALKEIKNHPSLRQIPVVVLTTSKAEEDIYKTYNLGVNSFVSKPVTFSALVQVMKDLGRYWLEIVELPQEVDRPKL
ncbi:MAG: response regulator [Bdellovibrionales bacterium]